MSNKFCRHCGAESPCYRSICYEKYRIEAGFDRPAWDNPPAVNWAPTIGACYFGIMLVVAGLAFKSFEDKAFFLGAMTIMWFVVINPRK